jgi:menaquinone-9 beta-reductase
MARIAIVGAGPSGSSAGYHLARSGHRVSLIDRAAFPRDKICGDVVSFGARQALTAMGLYPAQLDALCAARLAFDGLVLGAPSGATNVSRHPLRGYCVPRLVLDDLLRERAIAAGCEPLQAHVKDPAALADDHDWVIDARGVHGGTANAVAMRTYWDVPTAALDPGEATRLQIYFERYLGAGYGWIFPVNEADGVTRFNVGVGVWLRDYDAAKANVSALLQLFVAGNPRARALSALALTKDRPRGLHLAGAQRRTRVAAGKVLRVGDAANLTDPITGEGIPNALTSGCLVAEVINCSLSPADVPAAWQRLYEDQFAAHLRAGLGYNALLRHGPIRNLLIWAMNRSERIAERMNASLFDLVRYNDLAPSLLRALRTPPQ